MIAKKAGDGGSNPPGAMVQMMKRDHYKVTNQNIIKIMKTLKEAAKSGEGFLTV